jgi:hypothetical protein
MPQRRYRKIFLLVGVAVLASSALAQSPNSNLGHTKTTNNDWQIAIANASEQRKLTVVTLDQPNRKQTCKVQSFTADKLVCSHFGHVRTYLPQQILALIIPGEEGLRIRMFIGFNAGLAAAIWGTVVLAAVCPACAAATSLAAFLCFAGAGAVAVGDGRLESLLYVAPGRQLTDKLSDIQPF